MERRLLATLRQLPALVRSARHHRQIEVWDRFDYSQEHWLASPWRPANNVNYTPQDSALANAYNQPAWRDQQPFFHTVPEPHTPDHPHSNGALRIAELAK